MNDIMAYHIKRHQSSFDAERPQTREPPKRLKTIKGHDSVDLSVDLNRSKLSGNEGMETSPYATSLLYPLHRSKSMTKVKSRGGKRTTPDKEKTLKSFNSHTHNPSPSTSKHAFHSVMRLTRTTKPSLLDFHSKESPVATHLKLLSDSLEKGLKNAEMHSNLTAEMKICREVFTEIIKLDETLGRILERIRGKYELWMGNLKEKNEHETGKMKEEIEKLKVSLDREINEKKAFKRKFEKISRESVELSRTCDVYQNKCFEYQEKLCEISNISLSDFPPSEIAWRLLLSELETYKTWKEATEKDLQIAKLREHKLMDLLHAIKKHGFPVEEVYKMEVKKATTASSRDSAGSNTDTEQLVTGPPAERKRPGQVPALRMELIQREESMQSESYSLSSTLNEWKRMWDCKTQGREEV